MNYFRLSPHAIILFALMFVSATHAGEFSRFKGQRSGEFGYSAWGNVPYSLGDHGAAHVTFATAHQGRSRRIAFLGDGSGDFGLQPLIRVKFHSTGRCSANILGVSSNLNGNWKQKAGDLTCVFNAKNSTSLYTVLIRIRERAGKLSLTMSARAIKDTPDRLGVIGYTFTQL